jgi:hypothetical protein
MKFQQSIFQSKDKNLLKAVKTGDIEQVSFLLEEKADINTTSKYGYTPLMLASKYNHKDITELLLNKKAQSNLTNLYYMTAMMIAAHWGHRENIKLLIEAKADPESKCFLTNDSAIVFAIKNNQIQSVRTLMNVGIKFPMPYEISNFLEKNRHNMCKMIMALRNDQQNSYAMGIFSVAYLLLQDIWKMVIDYAVDFDAPSSQSNCFCASFWNQSKPILNRESNHNLDVSDQDFGF